jgi:hypothetical protein
MVRSPGDGNRWNANPKTIQYTCDGQWNAHPLDRYLPTLCFDYRGGAHSPAAIAIIAATNRETTGLCIGFRNALKLLGLV